MPYKQVFRRIVFLFVVLAVQALAVAAVAQTQAIEVQAKDDNTFAPPTLTIQAGDRVTFRNVGNLPHTATAKDGSFDTGNLNAGQSRTVRIRKSGTINYVCTYHETLGMVGDVVVEGTAPADEASPSPSPEAAVASQETEDVDANLPLGIKVFPLLAGGMLALALGGMGLAWVRNVLRTAENR
jgi:plastocyanin